MRTSTGPIFTIGHSTHDLDHFVALLKKHQVDAVADVRSQAVSRIQHFNYDVLELALKTEGVRYVAMGRELGARRDEQECYIDGQVVYERIAELPQFQRGISRLVSGAQENRIALMCAEKEPLDCHRTLLICRHLRPFGLPIRHILEDGRIEEHSMTEARLMRLVDTPLEQGDLFFNQDELIERAYEIRGRQIAFRPQAQGVAL
jgi:uncharacterized protein (DUF488 family)